MPQRVVTDECIDVAVAGVFAKAGHQAWSLAQAGLADSETPDDDVSVYAHDKGAALVTDDRELVRRREKVLFGQTVSLHGRKPTHAAVVAKHVKEIARLLDELGDCVIHVADEGVWVTRPPWLATPRPPS